ncbi:MAG: aldo/keto reductase [Zymomonas mobilis subsp. pomaceae]|uniref:Aldo/keto reductase n=1 Tax=Zymomonas mobilis subsp. pomaceae (strain ATCC 29192 / DSM 22645 / JCM 10191 / CCUG 17912 / NBRC 13757 / NCIMB 11200 / NRRL B-4491 / Barker I) TaxID=579138 RepID=F8EUI7_ZYMMT|nr:aldo/keto reductase [Zymomonas mobilis]AEI37203.1 aldo/keto reductase [Zymomonas mobilis subsp. pomaceae ATCC 29192]MDX5948573.1 aldo/keto reductase [Zymomonas mobilis subsp. pomaceae]GEB88379.1 oxidoreductase [Zymomonas mobilis subsp. pomaceae]
MTIDTLEKTKTSKKTESFDKITIRGIDKPATRVALGTWAIGGWMWGGTDDDLSIRTIQRAIDLGINTIDTAPAYGRGHSEEIVGKAIKGKRDKLIIATKVGLDWTLTEDQSMVRNASAARIRKEIEDSLRRLGTDYIDLYQVHWPDPLVSAEETASTLEALRKEGKIRSIGVSNYSPDQMDAFRKYAQLSVTQSPYNLFEREIDKEIMPYAKKHDLVVLGYGALCRGLLSGKMSAERHFEGDDLRKQDPKFQKPRFEHYLSAVEELKKFAKERYNKSVLALSVRWMLEQGPTLALWGARKPEQIDGIADVFGWQLTAQDLKEIDAILERNIPSPVGPEFMAPPARKKK